MFDAGLSSDSISLLDNAGAHLPGTAEQSDGVRRQPTRTGCDSCLSGWFSSDSPSVGLSRMYSRIRFHSRSLRMMRSWELRCHRRPWNGSHPAFRTPVMYRVVVWGLDRSITSDRDNTRVGAAPRGRSGGSFGRAQGPACHFRLLCACDASMSRPAGSVQVRR